MIDRIHVTHLFPQLELGGPLKGVLALLKYLDKDRFSNSFVALSRAIQPEARELIEVLGCGFHQLDQRGMADLRALPAVRRILLKEGARVLHSTLPRPDWYASLASLLVPGLRTVTTIRGVDDVAVGLVSGRMAERVFTGVNRLVLRCMDMVVPHSEGLVEYVRRMGVPEGRVRYIPNGLDLAPFESIDREKARWNLRRRYGWDHDAVVVGFVATLWPYKDHQGFVRAAGILHEERPDLRFLVVGQGPLLEEMRRFVTDQGLEGVVIYPGYQDEVHEFHAALDLHLFLSFSEGLPRAVLESMAAGTPVVGTRVTGVVDVIKDGETGLLIPAGDPVAAAGAVRRILDDGANTAAMVTEAGRLVRGAYSAEAMARAYGDLYLELCGDGRGVG